MNKDYIQVRETQHKAKNTKKYFTLITSCFCLSISSPQQIVGKGLCSCKYKVCWWHYAMVLQCMHIMWKTNWNPSRSTPLRRHPCNYNHHHSHLLIFPDTSCKKYPYLTMFNSFSSSYHLPFSIFRSDSPLKSNFALILFNNPHPFL